MSRPKWPTPNDGDLLDELRQSDAETLSNRKKRLKYIAEETEGPDGAAIPGIELDGSLMLGDALRSFIAGNFLASVLSAQAFLEHCFATALDSHGQRNASRLTFSQSIDKCQQRGLIALRLAKKVHRLRTIRNPYAHRRHKNIKEWPTWFYSRVMKEADGNYYALAEADARLGIQCLIDYIRTINPSWIPPS